MAINKQSNTNVSNIIPAAVLMFGVIIAGIVVSKQTNWFNHASGPTNPQGAMTNLNDSANISGTTNPDGTMGPQTYLGNWSNHFPANFLGSLVFSVTDPVMGDSLGKHPTDSYHIQPTHTMPTQAQGKGNQQASEAGATNQQPNGPQTVTSLKFTITKVEVHIAYLGQPGDNPTGQAKPTQTSQQGNSVDHWETLNLNVPTTLDMVQLAKGNTLSELGLTKLAAGRYTEVRLYVSKATATLADGTPVTLTVLGKDNIVRVVQSFTIAAGQTTKLTMAFDAQHTVIKAGATYLLKPVVARLTEDHPQPTPGK